MSFANTAENHLKRLHDVIQQIRKAGLKLFPKKCNLLQREAKFLGHIVSHREIETPGQYACHQGVAITGLTEGHPQLCWKVLILLQVYSWFF